MATTALIVPIDIEVLPIGTADQAVQVLPNFADFSRLPWMNGATLENRGPFLSEAVMARATPFDSGYQYPAGVHVHWALPYALSRGQQLSPHEPVSFPSIPNRWLVTRIVTAIAAAPAAPVAVASWVVESDRLADTPPATPLFCPTVPVNPLPAQGQTFQYLGQSFRLSTWSETTADRLTPFTAVGPGEVSFAAYYPNCCTSLGFLDTLADFPAYDPTLHQIAYVVGGWYSDATNDPLNGGNVSGSGNALGWTFAPGSSPTQTILCGGIEKVVWYPKGPNVTQTTGQQLTVAVGPSPQEALSAALAPGAAAKDASIVDVEQFLNALQTGLLPQTGNVTDVLPTLAETLHAARFSRAHGGTLWAVRSEAPSSTPPAPALPQALATQLAALNQAQAAYDQARAAVHSQQQLLYSYWNAYEAAAHQPEPNPYPLPLSTSQIQNTLIAPLVTAIQQGIAGCATQKQTLDGQVSTLRASLTAAGLTLQSSEGAARFWAPLDPVLLMTGSDVTPVSRYTGSPTQACRLDSEVVTLAAFAANAVDGSTATTFPASGLSWLPQLATLPGAGSLPPVLQALLGDVVMTLPSLSWTVIAALAAQPGSGNPAVLNATGAQAAYGTGLADFMAGTSGARVTFGSAVVPAARGLGEWTGVPWLPILLQYLVTYAPAAPLVTPPGPDAALPTYETTLLTGGDYALDSDNVELTYSGTVGTSSQYLGQAVLTAGAKNNLGAAIASYIAQSGNTDPDLPAVQALIDSLPQLSQGLTGLSHQLLMLEPVLQLPVFDPSADSAFVGQVASAVDRANTSGPNVQAVFNPLRSGMLTVSQLRLVDAFGRFYDYTAGSNMTVTPSAALTPPTQLAGNGDAYLSPRLCQPSRLQFNWVDGSGAVIDPAAPAASPIFAFVIVDVLNESLELYTSAGAPAMTIAVGAPNGTATAIVSPPPGSRLGTDATFAQITSGLDPDLVSFASAVSGQANNLDPAYLVAMLAAIEAGLQTTLPAAFRESVSMAVLMGQPLALARAAVSLQTLGTPAPNQSWDALTERVAGNTTGFDGGVGTLDVPVLLGDVAQLNDTLLGYFLAGSYDTYYAVPAVTAAAGVTPAGLTTVQVTANGATVPVSLLLDPRGEVNATTGLLPVKTIQLPAALYSAALSSMAVAFRIGALLSGSNAGGITMPLPVQNVGTWTWLNAAAANGWLTVTPGEAALAQASLAYSPQTVVDGWLQLQPTTD